MHLAENKVTVFSPRKEEGRKDTVSAFISSISGKDQDGNLTFSSWNARFVGKAYEKALGLHEVRRKNGNGFIIVYMGNEEAPFELELTWLEEHPQAYDLGECEFHLAFEAEDFEAAHRLHEEMGCICFENEEMGLYFIQDPDGYWLEIVPEHK